MSTILILANNDVGLYKFRKELIQELIRNGNKIYISLPFGSFVKPLIEMGCVFIDTPIDRRGMNPLKDIKLLFKYIVMIKKLRPSMVITYTVKPNIYGGIASRLMRTKYVVNITGLGSAFQKDALVRKIIVNLYRLSCKRAKVVFFENEDNQRLFIENNIVHKNQTFKLNGAGVNLEEYKACEYPKDTEEIRFLFIGRIMKEKGIDELLEVAKDVKQKYRKVVFDLVGPMEENYDEVINEFVRKGIIHYHGFQQNVKPYIRQAHCFVLPSYHEGMANTLLECAAMGRPLITSNIHGCKEAIIDGKTGYLVKVRDKTDLMRQIIRFIELPYEEKVQMGLQSRKWVEINFDKKIIVNKTIEKINCTKFES